MFQEWGNRGLHYWEIGDTNIDLIEGQAEYTFYRASGDGTSSVTVGGTTGSSTYGIADVLEATLRSDRTATDQADSALTKTDRSTYSGLANKLSKGTPSRYFVQRFIDKTTCHLQEENTLKPYQTDQEWSFHTMKWSENGMVCWFIDLNLKPNILN